MEDRANGGLAGLCPIVIALVAFYAPMRMNYTGFDPERAWSGHHGGHTRGILDVCKFLLFKTVSAELILSRGWRSRHGCDRLHRPRKPLWLNDGVNREIETVGRPSSDRWRTFSIRLPRRNRLYRVS